LPAGEKHFGGNLAGKLVVSWRLGGMGGAQPLAATMAGACFLGIDVDANASRSASGPLLRLHGSNTSMRRCEFSRTRWRKKEAISVGLIGNCAEVVPELAQRGLLPDILTDQTSAHDPLNGYVPHGLSLEAALDLRRSDPKAYLDRSLDSMGPATVEWHAGHCRRWAA